MVATGERTGNLGSVLQLLGEHYENDAESRFKDLATYAEPAMVIFVGAILPATTGVVAASVISMGLISLPIMMRYGYDKRLACGTIAASGTLARASAQ
mgnify:CR=1 FL=1